MSRPRLDPDWLVINMSAMRATTIEFDQIVLGDESLGELFKSIFAETINSYPSLLAEQGYYLLVAPFNEYVLHQVITQRVEFRNLPYGDEGAQPVGLAITVRYDVADVSAEPSEEPPGWSTGGTKPSPSSWNSLGQSFCS